MAQNSLLNSLDTGLLDRRVDLLVGTFWQREKGTSDCGVVENTSGNESVLESDCTLHVGSSVVNGSGDWKQLVVDRLGLLVVLSFTSVEQIEQEFWRDTTISNKHTVHLESGVKEILVMTGEDVGLWVLLSDDVDLSVPSSHVSDTVLH